VGQSDFPQIAESLSPVSMWSVLVRSGALHASILGVTVTSIGTVAQAVPAPLAAAETVLLIPSACPATK
jgi:hypothetical protein